ncbi:cholesterol transport system auxiliary component [Parvibaculum indicum]|uniref:ABC-type transport auxiliary lipoprotein family protein n=1 Tax=Parvibaculum indicum TaxID=562969 RepID=UPI00141F9044|nr:ABC-type transport auxiliary lipoprotein family protein [Parvibaculum indicum]NIJ41090.1 cholesterol transport system auxiliary component [Parvibaculum indicum]
MSRISKIFRATVFAASLVSLGGCALVDVASEPAPRFFTLTPPALQSMTSPVPAQLSVQAFTASAALETSRIVYQPSENEIKYYAGARWADQTPDMIRRLTIETLERSGAFAAVLGEGAPAKADYLLSGEIRRFAAMPATGNEKRIEVVLLTRLTEKGSGRILGTKLFSETVTSPDGRMDNVVGAYNAALGNVLSQLSAWTAAELKTAEPVG